MSEPVSPPIPEQPAPPPQQLALPGAAELFAAAGLETLPLGAGELNAKQLRFCVEYLACGNASMAARRVGYSEASAEKVRKTPAIARFLNAALKTASENGDIVVQRNARLSASLHHELDELRALDPKTKTAKQEKREDRLVRLANKVDLLILAALHRLGVKLTGEVQVNHTAQAGGDSVVIPPDALGGFATMRAEVAANNRVAALQRGGKN